jgi:branched-chain amino acid transport system permease protein
LTYALQSAIDALSLGSLYALLALGIALIFGIMQLINFAHGELIMVSGYVLFFMVKADLPWLVIVPAVLVTGVLLAMAMDRLAFRTIRGADASTLLVTSFAVSYLLQNVALMTVSSRPKAVALPAFFSQSFVAGGLRIAKLDLVNVVVTVVLLVVLGAFLRRTRIGVQMRAAAEDFQMARVLGVRANRVVATAFALSGLLAGIASLLLVMQTATLTPTMGVNAVIVAFIATVIGGMGRLGGAVIGGFVLGVLTVALQAYLPGGLVAYRDAFVFTGVIAALVVRPDGLLVSRTARKRI